MRKIYKKFLIFIFGLSIFLFLPQYCLGYSSKVDYYSNLLETWGLHVVLLEDLAARESNRNSHLFLLSTQFKDLSPDQVEGISRYQKIIIVCDEQVFFRDIDFCSLEGVQLQPEYMKGNYLPIFAGSIDRTFYIVFSEDCLVSPHYARRLQDYISSYARADSERVHGKGEIEEKKTPPDNYTFPISRVFVFVLIFFLGLAFWSPEINVFLRNPKILLEKGIYRNFYSKYVLGPLKSVKFFASKVRKPFRRFQQVLPIIFFYLVTVYFFLLFCISHLDRFLSKRSLSFDLSYLPKYLIYTLKPENIESFVKNVSLIRIFLLVYTAVLVIFAFILYLPRHKTFASLYKKAVLHKKMNTRLVKIAVPGLFFLAYICVFIYPIKVSYLYLVISLYLILYFLYLMRENGVDLNSLYSSKQRKLIVILLCFLTVLLSGYRVYRKNNPPKIPPQYESLINDKERVTVLPYIRAHPEPVFFKPFEISPNTTLFVDDYLIFVPGYEQIRSRDLKDFEVSDSFIIKRPSEKNFLRAIKENKDLRNTLATDDVKNFFFIEDFSFSFESYYTISFTFDCSKNVAPSRVILKTQFPVGTDESKEFSALNFPGCYQQSIGSVTYIAPLDFMFLPNADVLVYKLLDVPSDIISDLEIYEDGKPLGVRFIEFSEDEQYLKRNPNPERDYVDYFAWDIEEYTQNMEGNFFDISAVINSMKNSGILENPFRIWSAEDPHFVIKNTL